MIKFFILFLISFSLAAQEIPTNGFEYPPYNVISIPDHVLALRRTTFEISCKNPIADFIDTIPGDEKQEEIQEKFSSLVKKHSQNINIPQFYKIEPVFRAVPKNLPLYKLARLQFPPQHGPELLRIALENGADVNLLETDNPARTFSYYSSCLSVLCETAIYCDLNTASGGARFNAALSMITLLLRYRANPNQGTYFLYQNRAVGTYHKSSLTETVCKICTKRQTHDNNISNEEAEIIKNKKMEIAQILVSYGANINQTKKEIQKHYPPEYISSTLANIFESELKKLRTKQLGAKECNIVTALQARQRGSKLLLPHQIKKQRSYGK